MQEQLGQIYQKIIQQTKQIYTKNYYIKFKKNPNLNATVICSISLYNKTTNSFQIVSLGFGTKSLPFKLAKQYKGKVIKDMHAQVLAKRGFIKYILNNIPKDAQQNQLLLWDLKRKKHYLKSQIEVIMYVSEVFCGDCLVDEKNNLFSGAKPLKYFRQKQIPQQKFIENILRTKPGRLDLPIDKRTLSLSCSDKMGLWNILGIQGKTAFNFVKPIYMNTILFQSSHNIRIERIKEGINFIHRLSQILKLSHQKIKSKLFKIVANNKIKFITTQFSCNQPKIVQIQKQLMSKSAYKQQEQDRKFQLCGIIACNQTDWLNGKTGLPQGVSLKKIVKTSQFCSQKLYQKYKSKQNQEFKYHAVKERIKILFQQWTDKYKNQD